MTFTLPGSTLHRAAAMMLLAMCCFAMQDAMVKLISDHVSIWQFHLTRAIIVLALIAAMVGAFRPMSGIRLVNPGWAALRSLFMSGAFIFFYLAMPFVSLSQAAAAFFTGPLFITLFSALFAGERIGPRRVAALFAGFAGVLVIVRPWGEAMEIALVLPVLAATCYACAIVITRSRCIEDSAVALSLVNTIVFAQVALLGLIVVGEWGPDEETRAAFPFLLREWTGGIGPVWLMIAFTACTHVVGAITLTRVYQMAEASLIAPLEYMYLAIVPLLDLLIWRTVPPLSTFFGMILIAAAGAFVAWREGTPARPRPQTHGEAAD